jgi:hypothetical protein
VVGRSDALEHRNGERRGAEIDGSHRQSGYAG